MKKIKDLRLELMNFLDNYLIEVGKIKSYSEDDKCAMIKNYFVVKEIEKILLTEIRRKIK